MTILYHIAQRLDWENAREPRRYAPAGFAREGFIHCSSARQLLTTANRIFKGRDDLVVLAIDRARVKAAIRYENLEGGRELFPHIYGELELMAVVAARDFPPGGDGSFELPPGLPGFG